MPKIVIVGPFSSVHILALALRRQQCLVQEFYTPFAALSFLEQLPRDDGPDLLLIQFPLYGIEKPELLNCLRRCASCQQAQICLLTDHINISDRLLQRYERVTYKTLPVDIADLLTLMPNTSLANRQRPVA